MEIKELFGRNLQFYRQKKGWTQEQLAEQIETEVRTVSRIENGSTATRFSIVEKIAELLDIEIFQLFMQPYEQNISIEGSIVYRASELYKSKIEEFAKEEGLSEYQKETIRNPEANTRFDKKRNQASDKMAPIRVKALAYAYEKLIEEFPDEDEGEIWSVLQEIHINMLSDTTLSRQAIESVISAHQSWVKTSGTAFERFLANRLSLIMKEVKIIKPGELATFERQGKNILNSDKIIGKSEDDLLIIHQLKRNFTIVGVIQAKTSTRDRMKMDTSHSQTMLESNLWSIHITIDPDDFLDKPKFRDMADGAGESGIIWHGVYKMSSHTKESTRIFHFNRLISHLPQAVAAVLNEEMDINWTPK